MCFLFIFAPNMKLRRIIAILLMSLANILILAHAAVPHHHHDGMVFFSMHHSGCESEASDNCASHCCHDEETDEDQTSHRHNHESCDLFQIVERDGRSISDDFTTFTADYDLPVLICTLGCYDWKAIIEDQATLDRYKRYGDYTNNYTSPYVGATFGLRAPPAITLS